jgi:hypothetical protein
VSIMVSTQYKAQWSHTVSQHRNSFWTLTYFIDFCLLWSNLEVRPVALERPHRYLSIQIENIKIRVRMCPRIQFEGTLVLEFE